MIRVAVSSCWLLLFCMSAVAVEPRVFSVSPGVLPQMKARVLAKDAALMPAFRKLTGEANRALEVKQIGRASCRERVSLVV